MTVPDLPERLAGARQEASSPDGVVTAVVDGGGRLVDLTLDPKAMRLAAERLAATIAETVQAAQDAARASLRGLVPPAPPTGELAGLADLAASLQATATGRLEEITATLDRLTRGREQRP
jgi:DNA-binding protein YbaB